VYQFAFPDGLAEDNEHSRHLVNITDSQRACFATNASRYHRVGQFSVVAQDFTGEVIRLVWFTDDNRDGAAAKVEQIQLVEMKGENIQSPHFNGRWSRCQAVTWDKG